MKKSTIKIEQFKKILDAVGDAVSVQNTNYNILYQNDSHKKIMGDHVDEFCYEAYGNSSQICQECPIASCFEDGESHTTERSMLIGDKVMHVEITASVLRDDGGKIIAGIEIARDITKSKQAKEMLIAQEKRLAESQRIGNIGSWEHNLETNEIYWSAELFRLLDFDPDKDSADFDLFFRMVHPDDQMLLKKSIEEAKRLHKPVSIEYRFNLGDGTTKLFHAQAELIPDKSGKMVVLSGTVHDITERRKGLEALRESEARFRDLVETSQDMIWRCDDRGRFIYLNPVWEKVLGYSLDEMLGYHFYEFVPMERAESGFTNFLNILSGKEYFGHETTYLTKDGKEKILIFNARKLVDMEGNVLGAQGTFRDITEQKKIEQKLQINEKRFRNLFMNAPVAIMQTDFSKIGAWLKKLRSTGVIDFAKYADENPEELRRAVATIRVLDINSYCKNIFELPDKPDPLELSLDVVFGKNSPLFAKLLDAMWTGENSIVIEGNVFSHKGNRIDLILKWFAPSDSASRDYFKGILTMTDITSVKILEKRLVQSQKMATLGLLISGITHEINNPNNFIMFNLPILKDYLVSLMSITDAFAKEHQDRKFFNMKYPEFRQDLFNLLENMEHGTNRINASVSRLRSFFAPQDSERMRLADMQSVIETSLSLCQSQIKKRIKKLDVVIEKDLPSFYTSPHAIEQIVINLLNNASHASDKEDSHVRIRVMQGKSWQERLIIEFWDNGCGMEQHIMEKIFDPFYTTKSIEDGTGLGLFICHNLVNGLGGQISVTSKPGIETLFRVVLPEINP